MEYKNRTYREHFREGRWTSFVVKCKESDLWIGIDKTSYRPEMPEYSNTLITELRVPWKSICKKDPCYLTSLVPYDAKPDAPAIFTQMSEIFPPDQYRTDECRCRCHCSVYCKCTEKAFRS